YTVRNVVDDAHDTLTFNSFVDTVHTAGGNVSSGELFPSLRYVIATGSPTCTGGVGTGTDADPFRAAPGDPLILCTLPYVPRLNTQANSFYTVQAADYGLANHRLTDDVLLGWRDTCDDPIHTGNTNCNSSPQTNGAGSSALINPLSSSTATSIHNAAHSTVT